MSFTIRQLILMGHVHRWSPIADGFASVEIAMQYAQREILVATDREPSPPPPSALSIWQGRYIVATVADLLDMEKVRVKE